MLDCFGVGFWTTKFKIYSTCLVCLAAVAFPLGRLRERCSERRRSAPRVSKRLGSSGEGVGRRKETSPPLPTSPQFFFSPGALFFLFSERKWLRHRLYLSERQVDKKIFLLPSISSLLVPVDQKGLNVCNSLLNGSTSKKPPCPEGVMCCKAPYIPCESTAPCKYGTFERKRAQSFTGSIQECLDDPDRICVMNGRASRAQRAVES